MLTLGGLAIAGKIWESMLFTGVFQKEAILFLRVFSWESLRAKLKGLFTCWLCPNVSNGQSHMISQDVHVHSRLRTYVHNIHKRYQYTRPRLKVLYSTRNTRQFYSKRLLLQAVTSVATEQTTSFLAS